MATKTRKPASKKTVKKAAPKKATKPKIHATPVADGRHSSGTQHRRG
jgi:hypothetical protein